MGFTLCPPPELLNALVSEPACLTMLTRLFRDRADGGSTAAWKGSLSVLLRTKSKVVRAPTDLRAIGLSEVLGKACGAVVAK